MTAWFHALSDESETWTGPFDSFEEAVAAGRAEYTPYLGEYATDEDLGWFYVTIGEPVDPMPWVPSAGGLIDSIKDACAEDDDDVGPEHLVFADGAEEALGKLLADWGKQFLTCKYFHCGGGDLRRVAVVPKD